jgi:hypothetical protein
MFKKILFVVVLSLCSVQSWAWGFWAHKRLNRLAVFTLPPEMIAFYKAHIQYLTEHAVDPDKRRYAVDGEDIKHFIDIDHYGVYPFENVPRKWENAVEVFSEDTLRSYGIVPYSLPWEIAKLTRAFQDKNLGEILRLSADVGHYTGDSHVPLHTSVNYNGQLTDQKGIHGFWESRIPELFGEGYNFLVGRAYYVADIEMEIWNTVLESHAAVDSVLSFEKQLSKTCPPDKKYCYESRNAVTIRTYSREYAKAYEQMLGGQIERRMRQSILRIGSLWYTAWKNAGSPDLSELSKMEYKDKPVIFKKKIGNIKDREGLFSANFSREIRKTGNLAIADDGCCCIDLREEANNPRPSLYKVASIIAWREQNPKRSVYSNHNTLFQQMWKWVSMGLA